MAEPFDQLLLKMGIDLSGVKTAATQIKQILDGVNVQLAQVQASGKAAIGAQAAAYDQVNVAAKTAVVAAKAAVAEEQAKTAAIKTQTAELQKQAEATRVGAEQSKASQMAEIAKKAAIEAETAVLAQQLEKRRVETAEIQKQTAELRRRRLEENRGGGEREGGNLGSLAGKVAGAVLGRGLAGSVATGVLAGQGIGYLIEQSVEGVARFIDKLKEMQDQASQMTLIQTQFEGLAKAAGIDGTNAIDRMRIATEGLVSKMDLMKTANTALKSPFGLDINKVTALEGAVVKLAEANGKTATQAIEALNQSMTSGRTQQLMFVTGLSRIAGQLENVSSSAGRVTRGSLQMGHAFELITAQAAALGEMPQTLQQMITRLAVSWHDLLLEFGRGFNLSAGTQTAISLFRELTNSITNSKDGAEALGTKVGDAFQIITAGAVSAVPMVKQLWETFKAMVETAANILTLGQGIDLIKTSSTEAVDPVNDIAKAFVNINLQIELMLIQVHKFFDYLNEHKGLLEALGVGLLGYKAIGIGSSAMGAFSAGSAATGAAEAAGGAAAVGGVAAFSTAVSTFAAAVAIFVGIPAAIALYFSRTENNSNVRGKSPFLRAPVVGTNGEDIGGTLPGRQKMGVAADTDTEVPPLTEEQQAVSRANILLQKMEQDREAAKKLLKEGRPGIDKLNVSDADRMSQQRQLDAAQKAAADAVAKTELDAAKLRLAQNLTYIQDRKEQDTQAYTDGEELLAQHLHNQRVLEDQSYVSRLAQARSQEQERLAVIGEARKSEQKRHVEATSQPGYNVQQETTLNALNLKKITEDEKQVYIESAAAEEAIDREHAKARSAIDRQSNAADLAELRKSIADRLSEEETAIQKDLALKQEQNRQDVEATKRSLSVGEISPDEYYQRRIHDIESLVEVQKKAAEDLARSQTVAAVGQFGAHPNDQAALETLRAALKKASDLKHATNEKDAQDAIGILKQELDNEARIRLDAIQKTYVPQTQALQGTIGGLQSQPGTQPQVAGLTEQLAATLKNQLGALIAEANRLRDAGQANSEEWYRVYDAATRTNDEWIKAEETLLRMKDITQPLATGFAAIAEGIGKNFHSSFAQNLAESIGSASKAAQDSTGLWNRIRGHAPKQAQTDPRMVELQKQASDLFTNIAASSNKVTDPFNRLSIAIENTIRWLQQLTGTKTGAGNSLSGDQTEEGPTENGNGGVIPADDTEEGPATGASSSSAASSSAGKFSAAMDKFGAIVTQITNFATTIMGSKSTLTGIASGGMAGMSIGAQFGPIGAAIGAAIGATLGGIIGHKNRDVINNINTFKQDYKQIMQDFAMNTNNLQATIVQITQLMAQVQQMENSSKKGGSQYKDLIAQYIDQLNQLKAQQHQIIVNMNEMLAVADQPLAAQSALNDLENIFKTFQQNAGAAASVEDLANAYALLNAQLATYVQTQEEQLLQNNQQAIQDALQLNDLLFQQWQEQLQFNQQVQSILSQGVLVRTPTRAMTAGSEIYNLQVTYQRQQQQLQEQISAANYRVQQESTIFDLATTRIGLENQLLTAQNAQTNLDMTRLKVLIQAVQAIQSGNFSLLPGLAEVLASIPQSTTVTGAEADLQSGLSAAYQNRSMMGYATYKGQNVGL